jgi:hypothetical protein
MTNPKNDPAVDVVFVTFPRSGHHLLERGLRAALGSRCVYQGQVDHRFDYESQWWLKAGKTHDYDHAFRPKRQKVVVQSRNFKPAWESWVRYEEERRQTPPHRDVWLGYYQTFMDRWVHQKDMQDDVFYGCDVFRVSYVQLCTKPKSILMQVLRFLGVPEAFWNWHAIEAWIKTVRLPNELGQPLSEATTVEEDINRVAVRQGADPAEADTEVIQGDGIPVSADEETPVTDAMEEHPAEFGPPDGSFPIQDNEGEVPGQDHAKPIGPSEPRPPSCDPSSGQTVRGLGMGTTAEL